MHVEAVSEAYSDQGSIPCASIMRTAGEIKISPAVRMVISGPQVDQLAALTAQK